MHTSSAAATTTPASCGASFLSGQAGIQAIFVWLVTVAAAVVTRRCAPNSSRSAQNVFSTAPRILIRWGATRHLICSAFIKTMLISDELWSSHPLYALYMYKAVVPDAGVKQRVPTTIACERFSTFANTKSNLKLNTHTHCAHRTIQPCVIAAESAACARIHAANSPLHPY